MNKDLLRRRFADSGAGPKGSCSDPPHPQAQEGLTAPGSAPVPQVWWTGCSPAVSGRAWPASATLATWYTPPSSSSTTGFRRRWFTTQTSTWWGCPAPSWTWHALCSLLEQCRLLASLEAYALFISQKPIVLCFIGGGASVQGSIVLSFSSFLTFALQLFVLEICFIQPGWGPLGSKHNWNLIVRPCPLHPSLSLVLSLLGTLLADLHRWAGPDAVHWEAMWGSEVVPAESSARRAKSFQSNPGEWMTLCGRRLSKAKGGFVYITNACVS